MLFNWLKWLKCTANACVNIKILLKLCLPYPLSTTLQGPTVTDNSSDIESRCNYQVNASVNLHFFTLVISQTNAKVNWEPMTKTYIIVANNYQTFQVAIRFEFLAAITKTLIFYFLCFLRAKVQALEIGVDFVTKSTKIKLSKPNSNKN